VICRKESEAVFPPGVTVRKTDFSGSSLEAAFQGQDAVISAVGATAFNEQKALVDAAIAAGVQRFIPSEFSANSQSKAVLQLLPLFGQKNDVIKYLKSKESSGLTWTGIATSALFDWVGDLLYRGVCFVFLSIMLSPGSSQWLLGIRHSQSHSYDLGWREQKLHSDQ
jgi:uncharacterized protein YbjT (DUF2867 family)